jgi:hypothetical protein
MGVQMMQEIKKCIKTESPLQTTCISIILVEFEFILSPWIIIHDIGQVNYYTITHYN